MTNDTDMDWLRHIGKLNRDAITERNRADTWQRWALLAWAVSAALFVLLYLRW